MQQHPAREHLGGRSALVAAGEKRDSHGPTLDQALAEDRAASTGERGAAS